MRDRTKADWWKSAVFYQIYPRSFQDSNGDGIGDLRGIIDRLDYLADLGVDGVWISPIYESPQKDNGYDISDYRKIDPRFGTMADFDELVRKADDRDMIIIMDLVLNHTSDQHPWFREATKGRDNPFHDFYIWRDGTPEEIPGDLKAVFGGSAWTYVPEIGQSYFNNFSPYQPDLNWENPEMRRALYEMIRFWVDKGVGGFRLDAIEYIGKDLSKGILANGPAMQSYLKEMRREAFVEPGLMTVGEAWYATLEDAKEYTNSDGSELSMIFQFEMMFLSYGEDKWDLKPLQLPAIKKYYEKWQHGLHDCGWNSLVLCNHDLPRIVSVWGDDKNWRVESATMLAMMIHGMQGTPYVYQGEEIGMTNIELPIEEYDDLEIQNFYQEAKKKGIPEEDIMRGIHTRGRDNARTPMQWSDDFNAGFTSGEPWLRVNPNYKKINVEHDLASPDSICRFYHHLISLRKTYPIFREGTFTLLEPDDPYTFCYTRDLDSAHLLVQCNCSAEERPQVLPQQFEGARVLAHNYEDPEGPLRPYEARMLYVEE